MIINILDKSTIRHIKKILKNNFQYNKAKENKYFYYDNSILKLFIKNQEIFIDFNSTDILNRIDPKSKKCSVIKAIEGRSKKKLRILDMTAGLCKDTFTIAARGHLVTAIEKDLYIYTLILDALHRAYKNTAISSIAANINVLNYDSNQYILNTKQKFDCIYVDPMFSNRKKNTKTKKGMQILQEIAFNDDDNNTQLLKNIFENNKTKKVIVKRHIYSKLLHSRNPSSQLKGKTNRFDIYKL